MIETQLGQLIKEAEEASGAGPPEAKKLSLDSRQMQCAKKALEVERGSLAVAQAEELIGFLGVLEEGIRNEIGVQAGAVIHAISAEIQEMWAILHPDSPISQVRLEVPANKDKAIDICLTFFGVEQESPRLTLSEGYRNSLGLCVFLAMAKRDSKKEQPLFLDDVVISMDREHRGMVASLLEEKFKDRQVVVFTHDRGWYTELTYFLDKKCWDFLPLLPYESPETGIQWAKSSHAFDDARGFLQDRPDTAGGDARKIMDIELPIISEKLGIRLPFRRGHSNDCRMANEFLERLIVDGRKKFRKNQGKEMEEFESAIESLEEAQKQLLAWGNPAAHTKDLVRAEAEKLINTCEEAIERFTCTACDRVVFYAEVPTRHFQCECGSLRWRR